MYRRLNVTNMEAARIIDATCHSSHSITAELWTAELYIYWSRSTDGLHGN